MKTIAALTGIAGDRMYDLYKVRVLTCHSHIFIFIVYWNMSVLKLKYYVHLVSQKKKAKY